MMNIIILRIRITKQIKPKQTKEYYDSIINNISNIMKDDVGKVLYLDGDHFSLSYDYYNGDKKSRRVTRYITYHIEYNGYPENIQSVINELSAVIYPVPEIFIANKVNE